MDPELFRGSLRRFAVGVTVVTSTREDGEPAGMTATAFTSVSAEPPMVLVCVDATARTREAIEGRAAYAVNILAADQRDVASRFASKTGAKFEGLAWRPGNTGVPLIEGALAALECRVTRAIEAGSHLIYIGEVLASHLGEGDPLLYFEAAYRRLAAE
ncbi:MAG: flavin reductase family protein [Actinomycetota bacterium]